MKYFPGNFLIIVLVITSCNPCIRFTLNDFEQNLASFNEIVDVINRNKLLNQEVKEIDLAFLKEKIERKHYELLNEFNLKKVSSFFNNTLIFNFGYDEKNSNISCDYYLFFNPDKNKRHKLARFEQYSECRYEFIDIGNWTYVKKIFPCSD